MSLAMRGGMGLDALAKRYASWFVCLMLGIAAYFQAKGINQILLAAVLSPVDLLARAPVAAPYLASHALDRDLSARSIIERNPFDSVTGPLTAQEAHPPNAPQDAASGADPYQDPPCDIAQVVVIASADDPAWSFAVIIGPDGKSVIRRAGEEFYSGKVEFVGDHRPADRRLRNAFGDFERVWLTGPNGQRCQLRLGVKPKVQPNGPQPSASAPPSKSGLPPGVDGKIRKIGDHEFDVDRSAVDALVANPADLMKVRVVPEKDGDRMLGLKLFGIRPNTILGTLGLENGDRLVSINGFEMNDPQKMLEAYGKLMRADRISANVVRNGKPMTLDFHIK